MFNRCCGQHRILLHVSRTSRFNILASLRLKRSVISNIIAASKTGFGDDRDTEKPRSTNNSSSDGDTPSNRKDVGSTQSSMSTASKTVLGRATKTESTASESLKSQNPLPRAKPVGKDDKKELSSTAKESAVPGTRIGRLMSFGGLGAGLAVGAFAEVTKRSLGLNKSDDNVKTAILDKNPLLTEANVERIVTTLCRVRGAALKIGQMISIQDNSLISPELVKIFDRVRESADFMPTWQVEGVLKNELGPDWKSKLPSFTTKPFAAASIGQVHKAMLPDGRDVAIKIQYPGVAESIDSDINNLVGLLKVWKVLPEGLYAENALKVARTELASECDYIREATCSERFRVLLKDDPVFYVPEVVWNVTTKQVLTTELVKGESLDKFQSADQDTRNWICKNILRLCLAELFTFNFMQTDPNWSNFLYDADSQTITLLDFGASREFRRQFTDTYIEVIKSAAHQDRIGVLEGSKKLGFLTGFESKMMEKAHIDAVMILGEAFVSHKPFDFGSQSTAGRIHNMIPVMLKHRLTPPPEETYSLHRKMAGCFLLCAKLHATIECKSLFDDTWERYQLQNAAIKQNEK